jgi:hypothetical protein
MRLKSLALLAGLILAQHAKSLSAAAELPTKTALLRPDQVTSELLGQLRNEHYTSVALLITDSVPPETETRAERQIADRSLQLDYWIEIARNPELADQHPEWMASIQTHQDWRRLFPEFGSVPSNAVVKAYPWVPVLYKETFPVHLERVTAMLRSRPVPGRLFLNDLQGPPSACGCGNSLCRWTTDYGPKKTATRLPKEAAAQFVSSIKRILPQVEVIPVWTTECEEPDRKGACAGVGCFRGNCWDEWTGQLMPLHGQADRIGVLLLDGVFQREPAVYDGPSGWITTALGFFQQMPARYHQSGVPTARLLPVFQGWDVPPDMLERKIDRAAQAGSSGVVVAFAPIDQGWKPLKFTISGTSKPSE